MDIRTLFNSGLNKTSYLLQKNISAIQVIPEAGGHAKLGTILQLPEGAQLEICGEGLNERMVKVRWEGGYYFIFIDDIESDIEEKSPEAGRAHA